MRRPALAWCIALLLSTSIFALLYVTTDAYFVSPRMSSSSADPMRVHWAHAVNSQAQLTDALARGLALEADVQLSPENVLIMAHPPANTSDLTFEMFLARASASNCIVKLDFKTRAAFEAALSNLTAAPASLRRRIWLNADILRGSEAPAPSFDAAQFVAQATACHTDKLSVGWTTSAASVEYTSAMVDEMLQLLQGVNASATLPIKASLVRRSWPALERVYTNSTHGLTLWSNDALSDDEMTWLHTTLETTPALRGRTYYDLAGWNELVARNQW
ncbi:hypothetical protein SPRG_11657 [Saprolegnia parasitica CBS 223.65]|uniref:Menorin-like domain-containing protein n=1 Tax=Saprolegnia parasitica (strain CBS 223.65) TaxID=695850 RepID=A0A067BYJ8_SAPPC|nr:hypothetical protein SPRG_11657 [Saprolegnia parasitica CBS 223.65]KDO23343.1 hypothetical protein SPRG_11657 [Saprolegnia parasitica CBS 223.65]|eukprot:XP_012205994.1 hypothetical protein SPRG_11657 [Saprolegnia parasitica CBS 223.65]